MPAVVSGSPLEALSRKELVGLGLEYMLAPYFTSRGIMPPLVKRLGLEATTPLIIDEWMGASPVYTARMRRLMGIEGDGVTAIIKALQLDVGFVHQFMDVGYAVEDEQHATFWLNHCGALVDTEPFGEGAVVRMCHHIEDPTFDATAIATNPRAQIRPLHRPPRVPAGRLPHCHWTIAIDPSHPAVVEAEITRRVRALPIASLPNEMPADREPGGWRDYRGALDPEFRLSRLSQGALVAVMREFQMQMHLLIASSDLVVADQVGRADAAAALAAQWAGVGWIVSERLRAWRGVAAGGELSNRQLAELIALHPCLPPGARIRTEGASERRLEVELTLPEALRDRDARGWVGLLVQGERRGIEGVVQGLSPQASVRDFAPTPAGCSFAVELEPAREPATAPAEAQIIRMTGAAAWQFREPALADAR